MNAAADRRVRSLDGLRGLAATVVVIGHLIVASVVPLTALFFGARHAHLSGFEWALTYTPLHVFWAGQEWVLVFFVLSGFVLSLAASSGARFVASRYYPNRAVRLFVPTWAALAVAVVAHEIVSHHTIGGATPWLNGHSASLTLHRGAKDAVLFAGAGDGAFSTVLWSLQWEVWFSLLLPVFLILASRVPRVLLVAASLAVILTAGSHPWAHYMPTFMLGVVLAYERETIARWVTGHRATAVAVVSLCLLTADWWLGGSGTGGSALVAVGAAGVVAVAMVPGAFAWLLVTRPFRLAGSRSFSLYLVHEPIVVAMAFALGGKMSPFVLAAASLPIVVVVTELFFRLVERPSHAWARASGNYVHRILRPPAIADQSSAT
jgi:peptidoglycan/LPS O-acetylase OafA/YrhL